MRIKAAKQLILLGSLLGATSASLLLSGPMAGAAPPAAKQFKRSPINTGPSFDDAVNRADAIAEIEVTAVQSATRAAEGALEARVHRQIGLVKLPTRLHLVVPALEINDTVLGDRDQLVGLDTPRKGNPANWLRNLRVGQRLVLPIQVGEGGRLWNTDANAPQGEPDWANLEAGFDARRELSRLSPGPERDRRLAEMLQSDNLALARLALAELVQVAEVPQVVSQTLLQLSDARFNQIFVQYTVISSSFLERAMEQRPAKELIATAQGKSTAGRRNVAVREALIKLAQAGDSDAVTYWVSELNRGGSTNLRMGGRGLLYAGSSDPKVRAALIARTSELKAQDFYDNELLSATLNAGSEGFELVIDILTGKSKIPPRQVGGSRVYPRMALVLRDTQRAARLMSLLDHTDANVRGFAALGLAAIGHLPAAEKLRALFENPAEAALARASAAEALFTLGGPAGQGFAESVLARPNNEVMTVPIANRGQARVDLHAGALLFAARMDNVAGAELIAKFLSARPGDTTEEPAIVARSHQGPHESWHISTGSPASAVQALSLMQHPAAARTAAELAESRPGTRLSELAVRALIAQETDAARDELERIVGKLQGSARLTATRALLTSAMADSRPRARAATEQIIADFLRRRDPAGRTPEVVRTISELIAELDHPDYDVRERATARLAEIGPLARAEIVSACKSDAPEQAERAARLLGIIDDPTQLLLIADVLVGLADFKWTALMVELLDSDPPAVRAVLADGLAVMFGTDLGYRPLADPSERAQGVARWRQQLPKLLAEHADRR